MNVTVDLEHAEVRHGMDVLGRLTPVQAQVLLALMVAHGRSVNYPQFAVAMGWPPSMASTRGFKQQVARRVHEVRQVMGPDSIVTTAEGYALAALVTRCASCGRLV